MTPAEKDYILGTHDDEIVRLGLQHRVWRPFTADAWQRAGFASGQTILDIGCGPGYASIDLAEIVGPSGSVLSFDRSRRFLDFLEHSSRSRGIQHITAREIDLELSELPSGANADGAWCRWVFAFMKNPRALLSRLLGALRPGGRIVIHEYFDYSTWRTLPRSSEIEEFVRVVMESWRGSGGEPDIGLDLPAWLEEMGCEVLSLRPIVHVVPPGHAIWEWPKAFVEVNLKRLTELGRITPERAGAIRSSFEECERSPHTRMITPAVIEIIARRP